MKNPIFSQMKNDKPFVPLGELVYEYLYAGIINLHIEPGAKLNESRLADELEVSRTPIKYALSRLHDQRLVTRDGGKLMVVSPMNKEETKELYDARIAVEGYAAFLAADRIGPEQLRRMEELVEKYQQVMRDGDLAAHVYHDHEFHAILIGAAGNRYITDMYRSIESRLLHYRHCLINEIGKGQLRPILFSAVRHHQAILNALRLGFADIARSEMERDIGGMTDILYAWK